MLFYCYEKVFTFIIIWMIGKNSTEDHYLKKNVCSHLNMEDVTDADYAKRVYKDFDIKDLAEYHDLKFLPGRIKIEKVEKLVPNLHGKKIEYVIHIKNLKKD